VLILLYYSNIRIFFGGFSADKTSAANSAIGGGLGSTFEVIENGTIRQLGFGFLFAFLCNYSRIYSTQCTNVTDRQTPRRIATARRHMPRLCIALRDENMLFQALAVVDSAVLLSFLPNILKSVWTSAVGRVYAYTFSWVNAAIYWFRTGNTWLTVLLTVNRYRRVCQPLEFNQLCSVRRTCIVSIILTIIIGFALVSAHTQLYSADETKHTQYS